MKSGGDGMGDRGGNGESRRNGGNGMNGSNMDHVFGMKVRVERHKSDQKQRHGRNNHPWHERL